MRMIGYIPMTADLFHVGHVNVLRRAKDSCRLLIVGVLTDEAVVQYKGEAPVIPCHERMKVVAACRYADMVVRQHDLDPYEDLVHYDPDIFFSGGDLEDVEREAVRRIGCEHVQFPYYQGQSTTQIKETLRNRNS